MAGAAAARWLPAGAQGPALFAPLAGIVRGRIYTYQWSLLLIMGYFTEGVVRAWSERGPFAILAAMEITLSLVFFFSAAFYSQAVTADSKANKKRPE